MRYFLGIAAAGLLMGGALWLPGRQITIEMRPTATIGAATLVGSTTPPTNLSVPEASPPGTASVISAAPSGAANGDAPPQSPLPNPPSFIKGIYLTGWVAGSPARVSSLIALAHRDNLNAMVVDVKDYSGYLSYVSGNPILQNSGANNQPRMKNPNALVKKLHDNNIYVIARVTVFQDSVLAKSHPEWAIHSKSTGGLWRDNRGLAWMDASNRSVWEYAIAIANDAFGRGFDEVQFDYVRFPSDGDLSDAVFSSVKTGENKAGIMRDFFDYLRLHLAGKPVSVDLFGLTTVQTDDMGIGQLIEDTYPAFTAVSPMVYPSHYVNGFLGYKNPAAYPYEIVHYSLQHALQKWNALQAGNAASAASSTAPPPLAKLRPWLQAFDLGAVYTKAMVDKQIQAADDAFKNNPQAYGGWLLWDPSNRYSVL